MTFILDRHKHISFTIGLPVYVILIHWITAAPFIFYDVTKKPKFLAKYKVQPEIDRIIHWSEWKNLTKTILFNQFCILPSSTIVGYLMLKHTNNLHLIDYKVIPSFPELFITFTLCMMIYEISFFYLHWMLHHPLIYKFIHKKHHQYTTPISISDLYQHPVEYFLLSILPPTLGVIISQSCVATSMIFMAVIVIVPVFEHCGFHLPFSPSPGKKDFRDLI